MRVLRASAFFSAAALLAFGCLSFGDLQGGHGPCSDCEGGTGEASSEASLPGFTLAAPASLTLQQGTSATVTVTLTRIAGFTGAVDVTVSGLPAGATGSPLTITSDATSNTLTIAASASTPQSLSHLSIDGVSADGKTSASTHLDLIVRGPPGSLDELFGNQGIVTGFSSGFQRGPYSVALDTTGNILVVGHDGFAQFSSFSMVRVTSAGGIDKTFGTNGELHATFEPQGNFFPGLFPLPSGATLVTGFVGGFGETDNVFARVTTGGTFDPAYSPDAGLGKYISTLGGAMSAYTMDSTGRVVGVGSLVGTPTKTYVARLTAIGDLDETFANGVRTLGTGDSEGDAVAVQSDGKIVTLVQASSNAYTGMALLRLDAVGNDDAFGTGGYVPPNILTQTQVSTALVIEPDHKILALGQTASNSILARYSDVDGSMDITFGSDGAATLPSFAAFTTQPDGKILMVGSASVPLDGGTYSVFSVARLLSGSLPDPTFGTNGYTQTSIGAQIVDGGANAYAVTVQPDGRIVVAGRVTTSQNTSDYVIARYWP